MLGLAEAGVGDDLLLANQSLDPGRLSAMARCGVPVTVAVDSDATIRAATDAGLRSVLIDVNVGLPRGGCAPEDAARLADRARAAGHEVRGVMGYEGHVVGNPDEAARATECARSMEMLSRAHQAVGGPIVATALNVTPAYAVADAGLKALGMDHGSPAIESAEVWFCSDEHVTFALSGGATLAPGDRVLVQPAHIDPTIAYHEVMHVADGPGLDARLVDAWPVDLRGW